MIWNEYKAEIQEINLSTITTQNIKLCILREDLNHPEISGNKFRKLKYNLIEAKELGFKKILTFGGAFSNHIAATAAAGKLHGFETVGIIRGEELENKIDENSTLRFAKKCGMKFHFISREEYRQKDQPDFLEKLQKQFPDTYIIPEGGTNNLAIKGCKEILYDNCFNFDYIATAIGTGGTIAGVIESSQPHQTILGFPSLKGDFIVNDIRNLTEKENFTIFNQFHFGGYGKVNEELITFVNDFKRINQIQLDPIYTGKMVFGIMELIKNNYFEENSTILMIHTGGLQGIEGMNKLLKKKNKTLIE
ncbi:1-aminocyclopropane-1-carboxylate deaminase [Chishuiella changwenlii]|uniref:1-aminocyclopropane-1-carboxylate deaminase n=1 Tax=Chishuiella changwenlii TaxID=1434701 RepID=A0A1M7C1F7_9FLAO|nr:pyridoxal-phosphate dependent enzyme [Chishuiella changwenlii]GGF05883.1 1-aminocyclopropane-1-carboxylate deaminase [Chishuiella changwenlii]SHL61060.1 1-aminocyclopropane-1-carboxylate deaminase [Chishuiella changwenlii]